MMIFCNDFIIILKCKIEMNVVYTYRNCIWAPLALHKNKMTTLYHLLEFLLVVLKNVHSQKPL